MTFQEAIELKKETGYTYKFKNNKIGKVFVVPLRNSDFNAYCVDYRSMPNLFNDETSKKYSKDNQFDVYAIYSDNGFDVNSTKLSPDQIL